jgi:hypothetical protein
MYAFRGGRFRNDHRHENNIKMLTIFIEEVKMVSLQLMVTTLSTSRKMTRYQNKHLWYRRLRSQMSAGRMALSL